MDLLYLRSYRLPLPKINKNEVAWDSPNPHELWVCENLFGFLSNMFFRGLQKHPKILVVQRCFAKIRSVSRRKPLGNWDENSKCLRQSHFAVGGKFDLLNFVGRIKPTWMISWTDITTIVRDVTSWLSTTLQTFIAVVTLQIYLTWKTAAHAINFQQLEIHKNHKKPFLVFSKKRQLHYVFQGPIRMKSTETPEIPWDPPVLPKGVGEFQGLFGTF